MNQKEMIIVCDDAGFRRVDDGIVRLVEATEVPVSAEYMIQQPDAIDLARRMESISLVSRGLHFELYGMSDADRFILGKRLHKEGSALGLQDDIRIKAIEDARTQLAMFRQELGIEPAHVSTHGNFNTDHEGNVLPWWYDLMDELFDGEVPPMQLDVPYVRHTIYSWAVGDTERPPRSPQEFRQVLDDNSAHDTLEFVLHPAVVSPGTDSIDMLYDARMREQRDLPSAIEIIRSGVIAEAGYKIISVVELAERQADSQ